MPGPYHSPKTDRFSLSWHTFKSRLRKSLLLLLAIMPLSLPLSAQTGGEAGIQGTVTDSAGAAIPGATVTVTNDATGVTISRQTTGGGLYTVSPILPGVYTVRVKAQGFSDYIQRNLTANALVMTPLDVSMKVGAADTTVEVTAAPPQLITTNASLGLTIENTTYANLPLALNGQQRDPTYVAQLSPGATTGARLPIIGGTGNYLGQLYLDGLPAQTVSQQGDNRLVSQSMSVDAVDQIQIVTSTPPVEYAGAGASNFTMKSGSLAYHGSVKDFIRNTSLDAYPFSGKTRDASGKILPKPVDHQNELSITFGGHVPGTKRVFFFFAYDKYHNRTQANPATFTVPTALMKSGDFTELNGGVGGGGLSGTGSNNPAFLYDPTTNTCSSASGKPVCTRQPFQGLKNGVPTNNVIPASYISPIAKAMQQFLPDPTNPGSLSNNYSAGLAKGFDNHVYNYRVDFQWTEKHRISTVGALGTVNYLNNYGLPYLPQPYTGGDLASIYPKVFDVQDAYTINNTMVNQVKFGYVRFYQNIENSTQNDARYQIGKMGITNLPAGQAGQNFPAATFAATTKFGTPIQYWQGLIPPGAAPGNATATQVTTPNNFALVDNLQWVKGAHALSFGISIQWQQINNANPATFTGLLTLPYTANSTANFGSGSNVLNSANTGYSYASFLLGAVSNPTSLALQYVSEVGGRYRTIAPYVADTWKVNSRFTIDAGLRWDYLPPYREVKNRWSFMNPNITNPATGTPGAIQFAGNQGGGAASCNCTTPVQTYWKNWGPRVGITFSPDDKTVFRAGIGRVFSQGGGVGGRGGAFNGTGQLGFNSTAIAPTEVTQDAGAAPSFYLNNSAYFQSIGRANTALGYTYPAPPTPGTATQILNAGHYVGARAPAGVSYADPYFSGRAPNFMFYNVGMQRALTNNLTLGINYVGNQSHHLINSTNSGTGSARGQWTNQLNPIYLAGLGNQVAATGNQPLLTAPAKQANVDKAKSVMQSVNIPPFFVAAAEAGDTTATIAQGLTAFPQYSGVTDTWGNVGNFSYNSLQVTMEQRLSHGLTFQFNYTWSRNVGDDGSFRSGFPIPAAAISGGTQSYGQNRIDRSQTTVNSPHIINLFGVWNLPFGKNHLGGANMWTRALASGWQISGIYTYASGTPAVITYGGCNTPLLGQCMPDVNPNFTGSARINGGYGESPSGGRLAANLGQCDVGKTCPALKYFDTNAFKAPANISPANITGNPINLIGNAPRTGAWGLINPASWNIDTSVKRAFALPREGMALVVEADAFNTLNHTIFNAPNAVWGASNFGTIPSVRNTARAFELAGHFTF